MTSKANDSITQLVQFCQKQCIVFSSLSSRFPFIFLLLVQGSLQYHKQQKIITLFVLAWMLKGSPWKHKTMVEDNKVYSLLWIRTSLGVVIGIVVCRGQGRVSKLKPAP